MLDELTSFHGMVRRGPDVRESTSVTHKVPRLSAVRVYLNVSDMRFVNHFSMSS